MTYMTYPQNVIARAVELTKQNGGSTIGPKGDIPTEGFAFSPSKETEASVPIDQFNEDVLADYCVSRHDKLQEKRAHLGTWNYGDKTFMDVSEVVLDEHQAVREATKSSQIGIYDLKTGENKILSDYQQRADGSYLYKGKDTITIPEVSKRPASEGWLSPIQVDDLAPSLA